MRPLEHRNLEDEDINNFALYTDLVVMYHVIGEPLQVLRQFNGYELVRPMYTLRYRDACYEVQEGMRMVAAVYDYSSRADSLVHLAQRLQTKNTIASQTALFWLDSALGARANAHKCPAHVRRNEISIEEIVTTSEALVRISQLQYKDAA